jgi:peptidyl-prolyl cis-trans isomerase B (cyclophilin B)
MRSILTYSVAAVLAVGLVIGALAAFGVFQYTPTVTHHAEIVIKDYGTLHVELYGEDAPKTVAHFVERAEKNYYNGLTFHTVLNDLLYGGSEVADGRDDGILGEFSSNGVDNRIKHERGVLSMARGTAYDSAYGQFFIVTERRASQLDGQYAAFGKVTEGMDIIDRIMAEAAPGANGLLDKTARPVIERISLHGSH